MLAFQYQTYRDRNTRSERQRETRGCSHSNTKPTGTETHEARDRGRHGVARIPIPNLQGQKHTKRETEGDTGLLAFQYQTYRDKNTRSERQRETRGCSHSNTKPTGTKTHEARDRGRHGVARIPIPNLQGQKHTKRETEGDTGLLAFQYQTYRDKNTRSERQRETRGCSHSNTKPTGTETHEARDRGRHGVARIPIPNLQGQKHTKRETEGDTGLLAFQYQTYRDRNTRSESTSNTKPTGTETHEARDRGRHGVARIPIPNLQGQKHTKRETEGDTGLLAFQYQTYRDRNTRSERQRETRGCSHSNTKPTGTETHEARDRGRHGVARIPIPNTGLLRSERQRETRGCSHSNTKPTGTETHEARDRGRHGVARIPIPNLQGQKHTKRETEGDTGLLAFQYQTYRDRNTRSERQRETRGCSHSNTKPTGTETHEARDRGRHGVARIPIPNLQGQKHTKRETEGDTGLLAFQYQTYRDRNTRSERQRETRGCSHSNTKPTGTETHEARDRGRHGVARIPIPNLQGQKHTKRETEGDTGLLAFQYQTYRDRNTRSERQRETRGCSHSNTKPTGTETHEARDRGRHGVARIPIPNLQGQKHTKRETEGDTGLLAFQYQTYRDRNTRSERQRETRGCSHSNTKPTGTETHEARDRGRHGVARIPIPNLQGQKHTKRETEGDTGLLAFQYQTYRDRNTRSERQRETRGCSIPIVVVVMSHWWCLSLLNVSRSTISNGRPARIIDTEITVVKHWHIIIEIIRQHQLPSPEL